MTPADPRRWHLYVLRTREGSLYTGIATDVERRVREHEAGGSRGARALRGKGPLRLVYRQRLGERGLALRAERRLKGLDKREKERLVASNPRRRELLVRLGLAGRPAPPVAQPQSTTAVSSTSRSARASSTRS